MIQDLIQLTSGDLPLEERELLLSMAWRAHRDSCIDNHSNASNFASINAGVGSLSLVNALAAAILALGGLHGPVTQARHIIFHCSPAEHIGRIGVVPGFGNSFYRDRIDPNWQPVADHIREAYPSKWEPIVRWQEMIKGFRGKDLQPNAACFTAAVAELVGWPEGLEQLLVIQPRMTVWTAIYARETKGRKVIS